MNEAAQAEGAPAPVERPVDALEGAQPEAVKPAAAELPAAKPEDHEPRGVAKRLKELTDARRAAEAREERLARLLEETLRGRQGSAPEPKPEQPKTLKDFNYDESAYRDHLYTEARKEAEKAAREAGTKWQAEQDAIARRARFDERVEAFAKTVADYHEVVTEDTPISEGMADAIMDSDEAGALMYYLGNNPEEARKLYRLSPAKAGREIQRIEDRLIAERKKAAEKPVSQAPPPPPKLEGVDPGNVSVKPDAIESDALSDADWTKRRNQQLAARRKR